MTKRRWWSRYTVWFQATGPLADQGTPWLVKGPGETLHRAYATKLKAEPEAARLNAHVDGDAGSDDRSTTTPYLVGRIEPGPFYDVGLRWFIAYEVDGGRRRFAWTRTRDEADRIARVLLS